LREERKMKNINFKKVLFYLLCFIFITNIFLINPINGKSQLKRNDLDSSIYVTWEEESKSSDYVGMVESLSGELYAYCEFFIHTFVPKPENGFQAIPMIEMPVFIEETRQNHDSYMLLPYIVYYKKIGPMNWERKVAFSPVSIVIAKDVTFDRYHVGSLGFGIRTYEDVIFPIRTCINSMQFINGEWVIMNSKESKLGYWFNDHVPYRLDCHLIELFH
jgi:hypothetical protein